MREHSVQRHRILEYLKSTDSHPTAPSIVAEIAARHGAVSLSNVYRNLEILVSKGLVLRLSQGDGPDRFDANNLPHYHVECQKCSRIWDVPLGAAPPMHEGLPGGFQPRRWEVRVVGLCSDCQKVPAEAEKV